LEIEYPEDVINSDERLSSGYLILGLHHRKDPRHNDCIIIEIHEMQ
jgi:hypothetical protein